MTEASNGINEVGADKALDDFFSSREKFDADVANVEPAKLDVVDNGKNPAGGEQSPEGVKSPGSGDEEGIGEEGFDEFLDRLSGGKNSAGKININANADNLSEFSPENYAKVLEMHKNAQERIKDQDSELNQYRNAVMGGSGGIPGIPGASGIPGMGSDIPGVGDGIPGMGAGYGGYATPAITPAPPPASTVDRTKIKAILSKYNEEVTEEDVSMMQETLALVSGGSTPAHPEVDPRQMMAFKQKMITAINPNFASQINVMSEILAKENVLPQTVNSFKLNPLAFPTETLIYLSNEATKVIHQADTRSQLKALLKRLDPNTAKRLINEVKKGSNVAGGKRGAGTKANRGGSKLSNYVTPEEVANMSKADLKKLQVHATKNGLLG